jgi:hypothetical protein
MQNTLSNALSKPISQHRRQGTKCGRGSTCSMAQSARGEWRCMWRRGPIWCGDVYRGGLGVVRGPREPSVRRLLVGLWRRQLHGYGGISWANPPCTG